MDWEELLNQARNGNDVALGEICDRFRNYLKLAADDRLDKDLRRKVGPSDIVQQAMLEGFRDFESFTGSSEQEFRSWILRLLQHNLIDTARSFRGTQKRDISREIANESPAGCNGNGLNGNRSRTASSIMQRREVDEELIRALDKLSKRQSEVIELRHRQGLPYAEIALIMDSTEAAVRKLWERAVQSLQQHLASHDEQE